MESQSISQPSSLRTENEPTCKCTEGWKCTITKTEPAKVGKPFANCGGGGCTCVSVTQTTLQEAVESSTAGKVFCKCGEGWSCVVTKTEGPEAGKTYFECGEGCICVIDESNLVKVVCA